jgi:hypothetical protein
MANHAYVVPETLPAVETIDSDLRRIINNKFPELTVAYNNETWQIQYKDQDLRSLWIDEHENHPCILFRHGGGDFCWWVEDETRGSIACLYHAKQYDDAFEEEYIPSVDYSGDARVFPTLRNWIETIWGKEEDYIAMSLDYAKRSLPPELHHLI